MLYYTYYYPKGGKSMAGKKLFGIIYMSTTRLELMIVNLKTHELLERVSSANFVQTADKSKIYQHEMGKIVFSLSGFLQLMADYGVKAYKFWASQQLIGFALGFSKEDMGFDRHVSAKERLKI